jgi:hypothetical protein
MAEVNHWFLRRVSQVCSVGERSLSHPLEIFRRDAPSAADQRSGAVDTGFESQIAVGHSSRFMAKCHLRAAVDAMAS